MSVDLTVWLDERAGSSTLVVERKQQRRTAALKRYLQSSMRFVRSVFDYAINHWLFGVLYLSACTGESWRVSGLTRSWIDVRFHQFGWRSSPWLIIFRSYLVLLIKTACADGGKRKALPRYTTLFVCFIIKVVCCASTADVNPAGKASDAWFQCKVMMTKEGDKKTPLC